MNSSRVTRYTTEGRIVQVFPCATGMAALVTCGDWHAQKSDFRTTEAALEWAEEQHPPEQTTETGGRHVN